ncbi:MAG: HAMP domain-containing histidine kinase [candidate division Zixibacteria bacterium]|nr:HAMP domain-containing histidine kinase [candidate division Zixibacteria bacterium]
MTNSNNIKMSVGRTTIFKLFLLVGIVAISIVFTWYTLDVVKQLKADAQQMVTSYVRLWQLAANESSTGQEVQVIFEEIIKKANFPVVITGTDGEPAFWRNIDGVIDNDPSEETHHLIKALVAEMKNDKGEFPLYFEETVISYFYYGDSKVIHQLQMMPFIEIGLVLAFLIIGFVGFQNIRRSEERHIWVGMAKEAAHQLGTPISSLMGWLELLAAGKATDSGGSNQTGLGEDEIFSQMKTDVKRLQRVANRFGQIGSKPDYTEIDLNELLGETVDYFRRRLPFDGQGVEIHFIKGDIPSVSLNGELFAWVVENLIKNSLQAVDPQSGQIDLKTVLVGNGQYIIIELADNGKGIPIGISRKIFRPGFSTKKRGWGLGLTLTRRIVEEYHRGRIMLVKSQPGETIFRVILPVKSSDRIDRFLYNRWKRSDINI